MIACLISAETNIVSVFFYPICCCYCCCCFLYLSISGECSMGLSLSIFVLCVGLDS